MNLRLVLSLAAPYRGKLLLSATLMLAGTAVSLVLPWLAGRFIAGILDKTPVTATALLPMLLGLFALQAAIRSIATFLSGRTANDVLSDLRVRVYDHLQAMPLSFHQQRRQGNVLALLTYETSQLAEFITSTVLSLPALFLTVAGAIILTAQIDIVLAGIVTLLVPAFFFVLKVLGRGMRPLARQLQQADADAVAIAEENLSMLPAIKTFTREAHESARYATQVGDVKSLSLRELRIRSALEPAVQFICAAAVVLALWLASAPVANSQMTAAQLVSFLLYAAVLTRPVSALAGVYGQLHMARGTLERLEEVLSERPEAIAQLAHPLPRVKGEIEFRDVCFNYPGRPATLQGLDLHIAAGETVAITGANGAGKSTLAHLLMRLHEPTAGLILLDGIDIAGTSLHSVRSQIGIVPQHVLLFNGTVRDNIGYGRTSAGSQAIEQAARLAQAHDFIERLPHGYDTVIGDHGIRLSGGQRQRLALARALLKDPPILILDEATAMFDPEGERSFVAGCHDTLRRRTVLLITHRPASLALADRVVLIDGGKACFEREAIAA